MMRSLFRGLLAGMLVAGVQMSTQGQTADYPITPVDFTQVQITDQFWKPRLDKNVSVTIPSSFRKCEETGRVDNFKVAGKLMPGKFRGVFPFDDSDVYKVMEGAAYSLSIHPDPKLSAYLDTLIAYIGAAQEPDGYLMTWRTIDPLKPPTDWSGGPVRWSNIQSGHELYNIGHFYEAAVAHYIATGKRSMLDIAIKSANLVVNTFGPDKLVAVPGHEEIEIGLVKLYRVTHDERYLKQAKFFIDHRGTLMGRSHLYGEYAQDKEPVLKQTEAVGHAVRAGYLYSAMADISAITGDEEYLAALEKIWDNVTTRKIYLTGGIGARREGEAFGANFELPNQTAYNETCAAIANILWNHRMFLMTGDGKYIDVLEQTLYNGMLAGVSLQGDSFFYPNPLAANGENKFNMGSCTRSAWFDCSCCPSNVARFLPSIPGYVYATRGEKLYVNLFVQGTGKATVNGSAITITQTTGYPWQEKVTMKIAPATTSMFDVAIRIPAWATGKVMYGELYQYTDNVAPAKVSIKVNGKAAAYTVDKGYAVLHRTWKKGDQVEVTLPMDVRRVTASEQVADDRGKVAVACGPIVYCAESSDNTIDVLQASLAPAAPFRKTFRPELLGGVPVITTTTADAQPLTLIPYYAWSNRGVTSMSVWFADKK